MPVIYYMNERDRQRIAQENLDRQERLGKTGGNEVVVQIKLPKNEATGVIPASGRTNRDVEIVACRLERRNARRAASPRRQERAPDIRVGAQPVSAPLDEPKPQGCGNNWFGRLIRRFTN